jgi:hypothetical protein
MLSQESAFQDIVLIGAHDSIAVSVLNRQIAKAGKCQYKIIV